LADNLHDLTKWVELLIEERRRLGHPYPPGFARSLRARVNRVYVNWREYLRYHTNRPYRGEVNATFQSVDWLVRQYRFL
jgi:hypothetical protein